MSSAFSLLLSLAIASLGVTITVSLLGQKRGKAAPYAPGPKPMPLIGNLLDIPSKDPARIFMQWGKKYNSAFFKVQS